MDLSIKSELKKRNLKIDDIDLFYKKKYAELKNIYFLGGPEKKYSLDYYIEKYVFSKDEINKMKKGNFDINVDKENELKENKKLTATQLYSEICQEETTLENECSEENIRQQFEGPSGIKAQLRENLTFDIDSFNDSLYQKLKFQKLIYKQGKNNLIGILSKPTLENIPSEYSKYKTKHGEIIQNLINELMKELSPEYIGRVINITREIPMQWTKILATISDHKMFYEDIEEFKRINEVLNNWYNKLPKIEDLKIKNKYNIFETFFLNVITHQQISLEKDLLKIHEYKKDIQIDEDWKKKYLNILDIFINIDELEKYISENINQVSFLVFQTEEMKPEHIAILNKKYIKESLDNFINIWRNDNFYLEKKISLVFVISALQEIIESHLNKEELTNDLNLKYFKHVKESKTFISKLKQGPNTRPGFQKLWIKKVINRLRVNLGQKNKIDLFDSIEKTIDKIILFIYNYPNIDDIEKVNKHFIKIIERMIIHNDYIANDIQQMGDFIFDNTTFKTIITHNNIMNYFKESKESSIQLDVCNFFVKTIKDGICNNLSFEKSKLDLTLIDLDNSEHNFILLYSINYNNKTLILTNFHEVRSDFYITELSKLGLSKFFIA